MNLYSAAFLLLSAMISSSALAQADNAPLIFEAGNPLPLAGAAPADRAMAGDTYLLPFAVHNRTSEPVRLRRIAFRLPAGLDLIDANIDGVDNDRDGAVDEGGEGFTRIDEAATVWRIDETNAPIEPGGTVERAVKVRLSPQSEAGTNPVLIILAAGSASDVTMRAERAVQFNLAAPTLDVALGDGEVTYEARDTPSLRATVTIPSGQVTGLGVALKGSPAVQDYADVAVITGKGVTCDTAPTFDVDARKLTADFGACQIDGSSPRSARFVAIEARVTLRDADPFSGAEAIAASRVIRVAGALTRKGDLLAEPVTVSATLTGPLIGARLISVLKQPVDAGDDFTATYRLVNRGNQAATGLRLIAFDDGVFDCESLRMSGAGEGRDACNDGLTLRRMEQATLRDVTITARLRDDALFQGAPSLRLSARGDAILDTPLPRAALTLKRPSAPKLSIGARGDWESDSGIIAARIGDAGNLVMSGTLSEGRYPAALRLLTRLVDAQTGAPIAPAPLRIEQFSASPASGAVFDAEGDDLTTKIEDGWTVVTLPLGMVSVPVAAEGAAPGYNARINLSLRDVPEIQAGRLIEIAAQVSAFDAAEIRGEDWVEVLIVEPMLDLTVRSPDDDRTVDLHDSAEIALLTCNRGSSGAEAVILTADLPEGLLLEDRDRARVRMVQADRANDTAALFAMDARPAGDVHYDSASGVLRGAMDREAVLEPETCLALVFGVRRTAAFAPDRPVAILRAGVEPFTGRKGAQARIYPAIDTGQIRFDLPPMLFGPVSEREIAGDRIITHTVTLEIPAAAGAHRVDLSTESSEGLNWTIMKLGRNDAPSPWRNGTTVPSGEIIRFRLETPNPGTRPLGWVDTTLVRALALSKGGTPVAATTRLITRRSEAPGGRIDVTKKMALDRDCDGSLDDERQQDALFEPVKDASPGDCVIFRVTFRHTGNRSMERIVVRDRVPTGTELRADAVEILRTPEPLQESAVVTPTPGDRDVVWSFEGLFEPGAEGEVSYAVKLMQPSR